MGGVPKRVYLFEKKKNDCKCGHFLFFERKQNKLKGTSMPL